MREVQVGWMMIFLMIASFAGAQKVEEKRDPAKRSRVAIRDLKNGVLIVRLESDARKLNAMQRMIDLGDISEKTEQRLRDRMATAITERNEQARSIRRSLDALYGFSEVLYMYDTAQVQLQKGIESGFFLNEDWEVDPELSVDGRPWLVMYYGFTDRDNTSGIEAWIFMDKTGEDLEPPFPYYIREKGIGARIDDVDGPHIDSLYLESMEKKRLKGDDRIAWRLEQNMRGYYLVVKGED